MTVRAWAGRLLAGVLFAGVATGCGRTPGDVVYGASPARVSVGPVPGPGPDLVSPNPFAGDRAASGAGRRLFTQFNCAGCHGEHGGGGMGPSLRDEDWIFGSGDGQIFSSIHDGRGHGMPSWQTRLEPEQIWRLVSYIKTLRTRDEVEPPEQ